MCPDRAYVSLWRNPATARCLTAGINGAPARKEQAGGCGGFGKGNFSELFKSIEDYEKTLKI